MANQLLLGILALTVILGAAAFWTHRAERYRDDRRQRLLTFVPSAVSSANPELALVRSRPRRGTRKFILLALLRTALEAELAAAGDRLGGVYLTGIALLAAASAMAFASQILWLSTGVVFVIGLAAAILALLLLIYLAQHRYRNQFLSVFPDALDVVCRAVRAGLPVIEAMELAARETPDPVGREFRHVLDEMHIGVDIEQALQRTADRIRVPDFRFYVVALMLQRRTGGALAETLGNLSRIIRLRKELRLKTRALSAESKTSAAVLAVLPFFVGAIMYLLNRPVMATLFTDPRGRFMMGLAFLDLLTGIATMVFLIRRTLR